MSDNNVYEKPVIHLSTSKEICNGHWQTGKNKGSEFPSP